MKTEASTPLSVEAPGGICKTVGLWDFRFLMIEIEMGDVPEFAVTAMFPSLLRVKPKGCGATSIDFPKGFMNLPFGITVFPDLFICVYKFPEGEETTLRLEVVDWPSAELRINPKNRMKQILIFMTNEF